MKTRARRRQHFKGKKRPRSWHRSRGSSLRYDRLLVALESAEKTAGLVAVPPRRARQQAGRRLAPVAAAGHLASNPQVEVGAA